VLILYRDPTISQIFYPAANIYRTPQSSSRLAAPQQPSPSTSLRQQQQQAILHSTSSPRDLKRKKDSDTESELSISLSNRQRELVNLFQLILDFLLIIFSVVKKTIINMRSQKTLCLKLHIYILTVYSTLHQPLRILPIPIFEVF
jgi:hypothetical protein